MVEIEISPQFAARGVALQLGVVSGAIVAGPSPAALSRALDDCVADQQAAREAKPIAEIAAIAETRLAYKACGKDPSRYRPSAEALQRRMAQGKALYRINRVVDCNNLLSLESGFSIGAYDREKLLPPLCCRVGSVGETYQAIGRGAINLEGLPLLADQKGPFGSPTSDSERTMIAAQTQSLLMVVFAFGPVAGLDSCLARARQVLTDYCQGSALAVQTLAGGAA